MSTRDKLALLIGIAGTYCARYRLYRLRRWAGIVGIPAFGADAGTGSCAVPIGLGVAAFIVTVFHGAGAAADARGAVTSGRWESLGAYTLILGILPAVLIGVIFA